MKHTIVLRRALTGATLSALLATATACGDGMSGMDHGSGNTPAATASASAQTNATVNDADVMFAQMMIPHHRQAVDMADLAPTRANDAELKDLAVKIKAAQDPEIATMTGWLTSWGKPTAAPEGHDMHGTGPSAMAGMANDEQMNKLKAAKGTEFDKMFAQMMIAHHNGAIEMAKTEQTSGANPDAKALAAKIEADQAAEVQTLQKILDRL
ncbi:DUF305 domain-containing protein [Micromonospora endolithica]|uniref:DUF305 domain-containing protein n=1 Tax=Micromonospora endolithica TaxID=230091 RepID=A0A3A9ZR19_9ACTN|nr:DUF305 domain-containing protein [Micromonospora endolithica]RKN50394.1 DUF305 domain-containing protein [Micromonospora endolithica]TWJ20928.1 uncharacterized protein (DUF305 family) [Micromonospora endolithica]